MLRLFYFILIFNYCLSQKAIDLIMEDLKSEYDLKNSEALDYSKGLNEMYPNEASDFKKAEIRKNIINLIKTDRFEAYTTQFFSFKRKMYYSELYIISDGKIVRKLEREFPKYHSGTFTRSYRFKHFDFQIDYLIPIPTSSFPQISYYNEHFIIDKDLKIERLFSYVKEERYKFMDADSAYRITKEISFDNGSYYMDIKTYSFNPDDFDWEEDIEGLKFINESSKKIEIGYKE